MSYITKQEMLNFLQIETNSYIDSGFTLWLSAIEKFIEKFTGREFEKVESDTRYYDGNGKRTLFLDDDLISITTLQILEIDGTVLETLEEGHDKDFILYPYNTTPKYEIRLATSASVGAFYSGDKRIKIIGTFGNSSSVPDDIKLACLTLIGAIVKKGKDGGDIKSVSLGDYSVSFMDSSMESIANETGAMNILQSYKLYDI
jgi:hypothetical protein